MSDLGYRRRRRAPGAEHPVKVRKVAVNPDQMQRVAPDQVAALLRHYAGRAIGLAIYRHRPEQRTPGTATTPQDRLR